VYPCVAYFYCIATAYINHFYLLPPVKSRRSRRSQRSKIVKVKVKAKNTITAECDPFLLALIGVKKNYIVGKSLDHPNPNKTTRIPVIKTKAMNFAI
jgi:hypothetical protein|tara:strand:+ start:12173 stop:12463 length:291 start_codon:yes stop_codon:yes gene_type:complete